MHLSCSNLLKNKASHIMFTWCVSEVFNSDQVQKSSTSEVLTLVLLGFSIPLHVSESPKTSTIWLKFSFKGDFIYPLSMYVITWSYLDPTHEAWSMSRVVHPLLAARVVLHVRQHGSQQNFTDTNDVSTVISSWPMTDLGIRACRPSCWHARLLGEQHLMVFPFLDGL